MVIRSNRYCRRAVSPGISYTNEINDAAEVVGEHESKIPVLWLADGSAVELDNSLGDTGWATFHSPTAINNACVIVGHGFKYEGKWRNRTAVDGAFMLIPE